MHSIKYEVNFNFDKGESMNTIYVPETLPPGKYAVSIGSVNQVREKVMEVTLILDAQLNKGPAITRDTFPKG